MNRREKWFWGLVAAQVVFLLGWAGYHEWVRQRAPVIVLKCRPVDPQDLLRGDYMTLRYEISDAIVTGLAAKQKEGAGVGTDVWVLLEKHERHHVVVRASLERLTPTTGQILVRAETGRDWSGATGASRLDYGIERYFVPEGKGTPRFKLMEVEASVSAAHRLQIKRVLLDGRVYP
ncbi:MAG: GDYXXLXY domain-containing protein [Verrucomicrobia bacterium]|nr:GDYXXLXY domain-containing protein [Verrucomicrobiota bacterium]